MGDTMSLVKSFSVGEGDMFFIKHDTDNFSMIDCCLEDYNADEIIAQVKAAAGGKGVVRFISTHPDDDHIRGLVRLNKEMSILNFYCVANEATKPDESEDFDEYCKLRDDGKKAFHIFRGCSRKWMNKDSETTDGDQRKSAGISILWPDVTNEDFKTELQNAKDGNSANNISAIVKYSLNGGATVLWMGDLETTFMDKIKVGLKMDAATILFAPHHGRVSGTVPSEWLEDIDPKLIIIGEAPSEHLNYYAGYDTITQNSAGDITLECVAGKTHIYVSNDEYSVDFLTDEGLPNTYGKYIGTLIV